MSTASPIIAITCLTFEARIAAGPGILVFCGNAKQQAKRIQSAIQLGGRGIISIGIAGGLHPGLAPGDWVVGSAVVTDGRRYPTDRGWTRRLFAALPGAVIADIAGVDCPIVDPAAKRALRNTSGAVAADMESHIAAEVADAEGVPFAACRVIIDPAHRTVPPAAVVGLRLDGKSNIGAIVRSLVCRPSQLAAFSRIVADARAARLALMHGRGQIGSNLGFPYGDNEVGRSHRQVYCEIAGGAAARDLTGHRTIVQAANQ
jgi:hopanoid-associated phosphorylase